MTPEADDHKKKGLRRLHPSGRLLVNNGGTASSTRKSGLHLNVLPFLPTHLLIIGALWLGQDKTQKKFACSSDNLCHLQLEAAASVPDPLTTWETLAAAEVEMGEGDRTVVDLGG